MAPTLIPPKPRTQTIRPEITRLSELTSGKRVVRSLVHWLVRLIVRLFTRPQIIGRENIPARGPLLVVTNHLGDLDAILGLAYSPQPIELLVKADLFDYPVLGKILDAYGVIWVHRGQPDRRALRVCMDALRQGRVIGIAPEGRESLSGGLEEGTGGAAYLASKSGAPMLPVTFTGTENSRFLANLRRLKRTMVSMTVGAVFHLDQYPDWRTTIESGTEKIMRTLAKQLPPEYQGAYHIHEMSQENRA